MFIQHVKNEIGSDKTGSSCHDNIQYLSSRLILNVNALFIIADNRGQANTAKKKALPCAAAPSDYLACC